jgi:CSLREA domain-containing protein
MQIARQVRLIAVTIAMYAVQLVAAGCLPAAHAQSLIIVDTTADEDLDNASCSLREAIVAANGNGNYRGCLAPGAGLGDRIEFALGIGTPTIAIGATPLPMITDRVTVDGGAGKVELRGPGGPLVSGSHILRFAFGSAGSIVRNLVINNSADDGIFIAADQVWIFGCYIGTDATGMIAVPNQGFNVQIFSGNGSRVGGATNGGPCSGDCNVIAGAFAQKANVLVDLNATGAWVRGNFIGVNVNGTARIEANNTRGVVDKGLATLIGGANDTTPGGPCTGDCNVISGNDINGGIFLDTPAMQSQVLGNFIGTDVTGTIGISNGRSEGFSIGVLSFANHATIGGTIPEMRNVISGNRGANVQVRGVGSVVLGNYIGTDAAGMAAIPMSGPGVYVTDASGTVVGGTAAGARNLISGASNNGDYGVVLNASTNVQVLGNHIGLSADGTPLPNQSHGVEIRSGASNNIIGGVLAAARNTIAFNGGDGIEVRGGIDQVRSNRILGNSIFGNAGEGIALESGANDDLAPPTIDGLAPLRGLACAMCTVEIFSDSENEGRLFEGSVFTSDGTWSFDGPLTGPNITATNTDQSDNTSPFSAPFALPTPTASPSASPTVTSPQNTPTASATRTQTPTRTLPPSAATATRTRTPSAATATQTLPLSAATATRTVPPSAATATRTRTPSAAPATQTLPPSAATATRTVPPSAATATVTSQTPPATPSATATPPPGATATATRAPCTGDCNGDGSVTINELILGVRIALDQSPVSECPAMANAQSMVDIVQLIRAVNNAVEACAA